MHVPQQVQQWVEHALEQPVALQPLAGDASLRRYYRATLPGQTYIVMDASAANDETHAFVALARSFKLADLEVPVVYYEDLERGYVLLSDLGDKLFSHALNPHTADELYRNALESLMKLQTCKTIKGYKLPSYDRQRLINEMSLFDEWFWQKHLGYELSSVDQEFLDESYDVLVQEALAQPQVCVHRDYHCRNLMLLPNQAIGILDFQDAVLGPVTYDLVSLLRDCYVDWPADKIAEWLKFYYQNQEQQHLLSGVSYEQFTRWFDLMGLQRHLKCLGIFCRLKMRDNKPSSLQYLPRVLNYVQQVTQKYEELAALNELLKRVQL